MAKRLFGEKPVSETFIARRYEAHKAKLARWIASGRVKPDAKIWEVVRITNALELELFWATIGNRSQDAGMRKTIEHLSSFSPAPRFSPSSSSALPHLSPTPSHTSSLNRRRASASTASGTSAIDDLDTPDELAIRDLLLGVLYSGLGDSASLLIAQQYFSAIFDDAAAGLIVEESWVPAFARFHSAVTLAKEGDLEEAKVESAALKKEVWTKRLAKAETLLEGVFGLGEYDLKSRCVLVFLPFSLLETTLTLPFPPALQSRIPCPHPQGRVANEEASPRTPLDFFPFSLRRLQFL